MKLFLKNQIECILSCDDNAQNCKIYMELLGFGIKDKE